jgi:hypothetical protein
MLGGILICHCCQKNWTTSSDKFVLSRYGLNLLDFIFPPEYFPAQLMDGAMDIPVEIMPFYKTAINEFVSPEIDFTKFVLKESGIDRVNGEYCCDRYIEQDYSYLFYFKIKQANYFYRLLVLKDDNSIWSSRIVIGYSGKLRIKNDHNSLSFEEWKQFFKETVKSEIKENSLFISLNTSLSCSPDEIIELFIEGIKEEKKERLKDSSLENDCVMLLECHMPIKYECTLEIEKWNIIKLAEYRIGLEVQYILE